jgi:hypothetical protein
MVPDQVKAGIFPVIEHQALDWRVEAYSYDWFDRQRILAGFGNGLTASTRVRPGYLSHPRRSSGWTDFRHVSQEYDFGVFDEIHGRGLSAVRTTTCLERSV